MPVEVREISFHLDSGEWGELSADIEELKAKLRAIVEAEDAFHNLFEELEAKRKVVFEKHFLSQDTGLCQLHRTTDDSFFPLGQLRVVQVSEGQWTPQSGWSYEGYSHKKAMCEACLREFRHADHPRLKKKVLGTPSPQEFWALAEEKDLRKLAKYLKMPSLRDYPTSRELWNLTHKGRG